ncbi:hypothetical protein Tco_1318932 [Tanacetum coccineum]
MPLESLLSSSAPIIVSRIPCIPPHVISSSLDSTLSSKMPYLWPLALKSSSSFKVLFINLFQSPHDPVEAARLISKKWSIRNDDAVEPFISLSKTLRLLYKSSKLRVSTPGLVLIIRETCDQTEGSLMVRYGMRSCWVGVCDAMWRVVVVVEFHLVVQTCLVLKDEVHPQLPSSDATMHERPAGKVGMYTRFFDYANYHIPFSTFFMSVLTHFRIPFSQLSVFGSAKVDEFVVPANARFDWFSGTNIVKDRAPTPSEYNVEHVNTLIAQASPIENGEEMDLNAFIRTADPQLSASVEREFVGDASVGDGGDQGFDSVGGQDNVEPIVPITDHVETKTPGPKRTKKKVGNTWQ